MTSPGYKKGSAFNRRGFFRSFLGEAASLLDEARGIPQYRLDNLWNLSDEVTARIKPAMVPNIEILIADDQVHARSRGKKEAFAIFRCEPQAGFVFNRFNGQNTIGQISIELAKAFSWDEADAFSYTREFFLRLARLRVCVPVNPVG